MSPQPPPALLSSLSTISHGSRTMSPAPLSPVGKMTHAQRSTSQDSTVDGIRKRVCKACDRCRLKKSKCDGAHPCSRCKADNAICVFGERKKSHDKVYPKGYVEMLEQQQTQLVSGLQEMYHRLVAAQAWTGSVLNESNGHPLTHDILAALNLLESKHDGSGELEPFEEDCQKLQSRLISEGAGYVQRRGSFSSDSDHSHHGHARSASQGTPTLTRPALFKDTSTFSHSASPSPLAQSPMTKQRQLFPPSQPSPLHAAPLANDPQLYQPDWAIPDMSTPTAAMRSRFALPQSDLSLNMNAVESLFDHSQWDPSSQGAFDAFTTSPEAYQQLSSFGNNLHGVQDFSLTSDPMEVDFSKFIQVAT